MSHTRLIIQWLSISPAVDPPSRGRLPINLAKPQMPTGPNANAASSACPHSIARRPVAKGVRHFECQYTWDSESTPRSVSPHASLVAPFAAPSPHYTWGTFELHAARQPPESVAKLTPEAREIRDPIWPAHVHGEVLK